MATVNPGFGVYVHWPFCEAVCPYCDFNVRPAEALDQDRWRAALIADIRHYADETPGRTVTSLYFGGGTPSLMPPATLAAVIDAVAGFWPVADDVEITLETNPTSGERGRLRDFKQAGVNRLSVGVQSLDDAALAFLGRTHSAADAVAVLDDVRTLFDRTTFDLIYARPGQTIDDWRRELGAALGYAGGHVSLYQLTVESGTPFHRAKLRPADEDTAADMFETTQALLADAGLPAYEISNHARPGDESRHNLTCWRGGDYLGAGPGAHGRLSLPDGVVGTHQIHNPARWLEMVRTRGHGSAKRRKIAPMDRARELLMMGLRLTEGIDRARFQARCGVALDDVVDADAVRTLVAGGWLHGDAGRVGATAEGRQRLNAVIGRILKAD